MRIISGKFKGKKLFLPVDKNTRPLKDIVKESIFNLIENSNKFNINLKDSSILDLFSGVGSFGIECISRGCQSAYFLENYEKAASILKKNLSSLREIQNYKIFKVDCFNYLNSYKIIDKKFDIIFLDPPYKESKINELLEKIFEKKMLKKNGLIIMHRHKNDKLVITDKIKILDIRNYGVSKVYFVN
tara:strand:- start:35 stop:595 length:561 start_codon:yes stop_codon:yes gene_type:complete